MPFRHFIPWEMKFNYRKPPVFGLMGLRNGVLPAISVNNRCHSHQLLRMVSLSLSPEGMQERNKEYLPSSRHQGLSHGSPGEESACSAGDVGDEGSTPES